MNFMTFDITLSPKKQLSPQKWNLLHSKKQLPRQEWKFRSGDVVRPMYPLKRSALGWLRLSNKAFPYSLLKVKNLKILRKRGQLPYFNAGWYQRLHGLNLPRTNYNMEDEWKEECTDITDESLPCLNQILKKAKNIKSFALEPECDLESFKIIRKARGLEDLSINIAISTIVEYPQLLKRLVSLQKLKLFIQWSRDDFKEKSLKKLFESIINLPKLKHTTLWIEEENYSEFRPSSEWQSEDFNFYMTLLPILHKAKIPSFEIVVVSTSTSPNPLKSKIDWGNFIDTLFIGPIKTLERQDKESPDWPWAKRPERRLRIHYTHYNVEMHQLFSKSVTIKNLTLQCEFCKTKKCSEQDSKSLLKLLSHMKSLENITMTLEVLSKQACAFISSFSQKFSRIESLQSVTTLTLDFKNEIQSVLPISPPYGKKMKNLKSLSLKVLGCSLNLSLFIEAIKELETLENFNFDYEELNRDSCLKELDCGFPFGKLKNLKSISLKCDIPFSENAREQLVKKIGEVKSLEILKIKGEIFNGLAKKKESELIEILRLKENLELANFSWKGAQWIEVNIKRVNGNMVTSSCRKEVESDDDNEEDDESGEDEEEDYDEEREESD